jgi:hypothetical protein
MAEYARIEATCLTKVIPILPTLFVDIEVCRRDKHWQPEHYYFGDEVYFGAIELTLPVEKIYARVMNDDMLSHRRE